MKISMYFNKILIILLILILFGIFIFWNFYNKETLINFQSNIVVPKKIWTYWDNTYNVPLSVKYCINGWKRQNPNYEIILLTQDNYEQYVTIPERIKNHPNYKDNSQRFSDLIRCYTLAEHGGIWSDASIVMTKPVDDWLFPMYTNFIGFHSESMGGVNGEISTLPPLIDSWFFVCTPDSEFMKLWRDEFSKLADYENVEQYVNLRKEKYNINTDRINSNLLNYLAIYFSVQKIIQYDKYPLEKLTLRKSEDGPFLYLQNFNWHSEKAVEIFYIEDSEIKIKDKYKINETPIMKLRSEDRNVLDKQINNSK